MKLLMLPVAWIRLNAQLDQQFFAQGHPSLAGDGEGSRSFA